MNNNQLLAVKKAIKEWQEYAESGRLYKECKTIEHYKKSTDFSIDYDFALASQNNCYLCGAFNCDECPLKQCSIHYSLFRTWVSAHSRFKKRKAARAIVDCLKQWLNDNDRNEVI